MLLFHAHEHYYYYLYTYWYSFFLAKALLCDYSKDWLRGWFTFLGSCFFAFLLFLFPFLFMLSQLYLSTYDAVVVGDGSFEYVRSLLDDILQLPHSPLGGSGGGAAGEVGSAGAGGAIGNAVFGRGTVSGAVSGVGGVAMGLRSRLGQLLNPTTAANPSTQPQQQQVYPQHQYQQYQQGRQLLPPPPSAGFPPQYNPAQPSPPPHQPQYHPPTAGATAGGAGAYPPSPSSPQQPSQQRTYQGNVQGISEYDAPQRAPGAQQGEQKTFMDFTREY